MVFLICVFADFMSVVRVGTHETAWEPGCRSMRPFAWVHVEKRMRPSSIPTARHFPIAVASFGIISLSGHPPSVGIISLTTVSVAAGSSAVAAATKAFSYHGFFIARKHQIECMAHVRSK